MSNVFFYTMDRGGRICPALAFADDGVFIGGTPTEIVMSVSISDEEAELPLDVLRKLYPYD